jgi:hypothetical protein
LVPNKPLILQTTAAEAHQAGKFLVEEQTLNVEKSSVYQTGTRRTAVSKDKGRIYNQSMRQHYKSTIPEAIPFSLDESTN